MGYLFIVKVGSKYLNFSQKSCDYVLVEYIGQALQFHTLEEAIENAKSTVSEGKYLKQKKTILKYKVSLEESIALD